MTDDPHLSTRDRPGDYDAIETAKPGEPLFPLQGGDPFAPATIRCWAELAREEARRIMSGGRAEFEPSEDRPDYEPTEADRNDAKHLLRKATQAEEVSWAFEAYQRNEVEPVGTRASYNEGAGVELAAEAQAQVDERKALINYAAQLNNGVGIVHDVAEGLAKRRVQTTAQMKIVEAVDLLKDAARMIEPRRGNERS